MGQGVRGPGPSEVSEKCSQEDARLLRPVADTRGQGGAAGTAAGGGSRPDPARGRTKSGRGGRLLAPACGVGPLEHRSGRGEPRAPAAPRRGREGGHSPRVRRPTASPSTPEPPCRRRPGPFPSTTAAPPRPRADPLSLAPPRPEAENPAAAAKQISSHQLKTLREKRLTCSEQGGILLADCS
ncbi:WAS/WASL-interacting protein family member 3-like isoform X2 [Trachypithecus francoisi]|uniref:WAS/WASL-interacting protein family member 3-like isoform X2 n=1 Tax=Trachypithecus francoisi TaxID=54180 RepID=UPI00141AE943|nr:WAS/WASL-interacting protein family member 3-like isoform X2 [Trachypithecus francoisi]